MRIAIGCDEAAVGLTDVLRQQLKEKNIELKDFGVHAEDKGYGAVKAWSETVKQKGKRLSEQKERFGQRPWKS